MIMSCDISGKNGASNFIRRLSKCFPIVGPKEKADVHLLGPHGSTRRGMINIMRLDGVYYDIKRMPMNKAIYSTAKKCDAIIYQSKWSETMFKRMCGIIRVPSTIIYNGSELSTPVEKNRKGFDKVFVCSASWRPNKRLGSICNAFSKVRREHNVGLFVAGTNISQEGVICFENVPNERIVSLYRDCDYMVHISHMESCSNSVVEAMCCGLPVLCNNIGGTPEIVGSSGLVVDIDKEFDFRPIKNMETVGDKSIDADKVAEGMKEMIKKEWYVIREDLDINCIGKQYVAFVERLL